MSTRNSDSSTSSLQESYRLGDSDSDDENDTITESSSAQSQELNDLKIMSKELIDGEWKRNLNIQLLTNLLELDEPSISPKMVDFLLHDGVCDLLLNFVTQIGSRRRPYPHENDSVELKFSYRVITILCVDQPSGPVLTFLSRRVELITRAMFEVFREDSAGSFYHAARVIETLLRFLPSEVYTALVSDGLLEERMSRLLKYIGYPPVGDLLVILVGLTPIPRSSPLYSSASTARWKFFEGLSEWIFLSQLMNVMLQPEEYCVTVEYISAEQHSSAAAQTLSEIIDKLSSDDFGEIILQPLGYSTNLIPSLILSGTENDESFASRRSSCLRLLCFLLRKSANEYNTIYLSGGGNPPVPTTIPNRIYPLRSLILDHFLDNFGHLDQALLSTSSTTILQSVSHPGHICSTPFSSYRSQLVELLVLIIEAVPSCAQSISSNLWKLLIGWNFQFPHNNIYHSMFYKLIFTVLRQNDEETLKILFKSAKLITLLLDAFEIDSDSSSSTIPDPGAASRCSLTLIEKKSLRGFVINTTNAIRLQTSSLPPSSFLRKFLHSHQRWNEFIPALRNVTLCQQTSGMGFPIPTVEPGSSVSHLASLLASSQVVPEDHSGIDHGSSYAKSLGFDLEIDWPIDDVDFPKKKKKGKKKSQKKKTCVGDEDNDDDHTERASLDSEDSRDSDCLSDEERS